MDAAAAASSAELATLLDDELSFDATTRGRLSNHLPMALVALSRLGAPDARLAEFAAGYRARLAPLDETTAIATFDEWRDARGRHGAYGAIRAYLEPLVATDGADDVVRRHLGHLVDGLSGAAFHGIIRLAYALEAASPARVAAGLAYLTEVHQPLGPRSRHSPRTDEPLVALERLAAVVASEDLAPSGNIGQRMRAVATHDAFDGVVDWLEITATTPQRLTSAALALYAATDDFTALHGLTGSHAIAVLAPYVEDRDALCAWWFQALAAAYVTIGAPGLTDAAAPLASWLAAPRGWAELASAATASDDEHVVKLVYTARSLDAREPDPMLRAVAARQCGLAPTAAGER